MRIAVLRFSGHPAPRIPLPSDAPCLLSSPCQSAGSRSASFRQTSPPEQHHGRSMSCDRGTAEGPSTLPSFLSSGPDPVSCLVLTWSCRDARQAANGLDPVARAARRGLGSGTGWLWAKTVNLHDFHRNLLRATQCHIMPEPAAEGGWPWNEYAPPKLPPPPPFASDRVPALGIDTQLRYASCL